MNWIWGVVFLVYGLLFVAAVGLSVWAAFRPRVDVAERVDPHIPDPRDTEITFLRDRVRHLEEMLHGTARDNTAELAAMLRESLIGGGTGLPLATTGLTDDTPDTLDGPGFDDDQQDWTDDLIPDTAGLPFVPPPPEGFPVP